MLAPVNVVRSRLMNENPLKERKRRKTRPPRKPLKETEVKESRDDKHIDITA